MSNNVKKTGKNKFTTKFIVLAFIFLLFSIFSSSAEEIYWEEPRAISKAQGKFPQLASNKNFSIVVWQEAEATSETTGNIYLSMAVSSGGAFKVKGRFAGPFSYSGKEPNSFSCAIDKNNVIAIAVSESNSGLQILKSKDMGNSFTVHDQSFNNNPEVAPRIFARERGGFLLFIAQGTEDALSISYSYSDDAVSWQEFTPLVNKETFRLNFLPTCAGILGKNNVSSDVVVFQSLSSGVRPSFQLWSMQTLDGGATWSEPIAVTSFTDTITETNSDPYAYDNQRPFISVTGNNFSLVWERKTLSGSSQIFFESLNENGLPLQNAQRVSSGQGSCNNPQIFQINNTNAVIWTDDRKGDSRVYMAQKNAFDWIDEDLSLGRGSAMFARAVYLQNKLFAFWQRTAAGIPQIFILSPDLQTEAPSVRAIDFAQGKKSKKTQIKIAWDEPKDSSGIKGYSYSWSTNKESTAEESTIPPLLANTKDISLNTNEDGLYYFSIKALDYAGNWSEAATISYERDTEPPVSPIIKDVLLDENLFAISNTLNIDWEENTTEALLGYQYSFQYINSITDYINATKTNPDKTLADKEYSEQIYKKYSDYRGLNFTERNTFTLNNTDDGIYLFMINAVDSVGNVSKTSFKIVKMNKFIPYTIITFADFTQDDFGQRKLRLLGRGFTSDGLIQKIVLDRDGKEPYDLLLEASKSEFRIDSDTIISGADLGEIEEGVYKIGLEHSKRLWYWTGNRLTISDTGTIKFGDYSTIFKPSWKLTNSKIYKLSVFDIITLLLFITSIVGFILSIRSVLSIRLETAIIHAEAISIIKGTSMPLAKKKAQMKNLKRRGLSLSLKFTMFIIALVIMVVFMVSIPLGYFMIQTQSKILADGLEKRALVLLESIGQGVRSYLPAQNLLELGFLPDQSKAMKEARYITITGYGAENKISPEAIWATNDPVIASKIDTDTIQNGKSLLNDPLSPLIEEISTGLNQRAKEEIGAINETIASLTKEAQAIASNTDSVSIKRLEEISTTNRGLELKLNEKLSEIANSATMSFPEFNASNLETSNKTYIFYKPVLYRQSQDQNYYRGMVRLEVSTDSILQEVDTARNTLISISGFITLIAIALGAIGSLVLAKIIVSPIKRLVKGVELIRDTEDKEELDNFSLNVKTKDEIYELADTIEQMVHNLVKAAAASKDLTVGKETQKMFIPLEKDSLGVKLSTGKESTKGADFFGYYEGAKGVSGDYFDFEKLNDRHYAIIKCDVAGKGVPAALIMVQVATLFLTYFKNWNEKKDGFMLEKLVYQINDLIEARGFKGRFAAFTIAIFDSISGDTWICNAGDTLLHTYKASKNELITDTLPDSPTAGTFPNFLVEMKSPYKTVQRKLEVGDMMLLYTDGIEEGQRKFRDTNFNVITCAVGEKKDDVHLNHSYGQDNEQIGADRVKDIVETIISKGKYTLIKHHNPIANEVLTFDFSNSTGSVEDVIMGLVSIEKIFRMYKDSKSNDSQVVKVDTKVDEYLEKHFDQYRLFCGNKRVNDKHPEYREYLGVKEDAQYDDLTLLGIQKTKIN